MQVVQNSDAGPSLPQVEATSALLHALLIYCLGLGLEAYQSFLQSPGIKSFDMSSSFLCLRKLNWRTDFKAMPT